MVRFFLLLAGMILLSGQTAQAASPRLSLQFDPPLSDVYIGQEAFFHVRLLDRIGVSEIMVEAPLSWKFVCFPCNTQSSVYVL